MFRGLGGEMPNIKPADALHIVEECQKTWNALEDKRTNLIHQLESEFQQSAITVGCGEEKILVSREQGNK